MSLYAKLRDHYYHLLLGLVAPREVQAWVNLRIKATRQPKPWMVAAISARSREALIQALGEELGPFAPMNYHSLLGSLLFRFKSEQTDAAGLAAALQTLTEFDPQDKTPLLNLALRVTYIRDALIDQVCTAAEAVRLIDDAFEECETALFEPEPADDDASGRHVDDAAQSLNP